MQIEYDPNRSARIALIEYPTDEKTSERTSSPPTG